jgi:hypothetical protein
MVFTAISRSGFLYYRIFSSKEDRLNAKGYRMKILIPLVAKLRRENRLSSAIWMQDGYVLV